MIKVTDLLTKQEIIVDDSKKKISEEECRKSILEMKRFNELVPFREISLPRRKEIETAHNKEGIGKDKKSMNDGL